MRRKRRGENQEEEGNRKGRGEGKSSLENSLFHEQFHSRWPEWSARERSAARLPEQRNPMANRSTNHGGSIPHLSCWSEEEEVSVVTAAVCLGRAAIVSYLTHHTATVHVTVLYKRR